MKNPTGSETPIKRNWTDKYMRDTTPCHGCGTPTPYVLLDAKPEIGQEHDENANYTRLLCKTCYGPGWSEM